MTAVIATGHRPKSMGIPNPYSRQVLKALKECAIAYLDEMNPDKVIVGGALGWDMAVGEGAVELDINLTLVLPFESQGSNWPKDSQKQLSQIKSNAKQTIIASKGGYSRNAMMRRNSKMLELANPEDSVLALWNPQKKGGTWDFIQKAQKQDLLIINAWDYFASWL